nr:hypothetical protein [Haloferula luteola]
MERHDGFPTVLGAFSGNDDAWALILAEMDLRPDDAEKLTKAQPGVDCHDVEQTVVLRHGQQPVELGIGNRPALLLAPPNVDLLDQSERIVLDAALLHHPAKKGVHRVQILVQRFGSRLLF